MDKGLREQKTVIVGLGSTGLSCVRYLKERGCFVAVTDSRREPPALATLQHDFPDVPAAVGEFSSSFIRAADQLIISPGVSIHDPLIAEQKEKGVPVLGDVELFARENKKPVLAITGSNGKTTVTTLLGRMVEASGYTVSVCGNIGCPVLDVLDDQSDFYVMELSSFQLETTDTLKTVAATVLNVAPDHMDRYKNFSDYVKAKQRIYQHCAHPVINSDQPEIWSSLSFVADPIHFTLKTPQPKQFGLCESSGQMYLAQGSLLLLPTRDLLLQGQHHYQNALAALAMGFAVGLPMETMLSVLKMFEGISHRCQFVAEKGGVHWFNDSKGTNVGATIAAIQTLANRKQTGRLFLIAGGDAKNADLSELQTPVKASVAHAMLFGRDADKIAAVIDGLIPYEKVSSLEAAVRRAAEVAIPGDTVLLSPACASFDMFQDYEHRGQAFIDLVKQL